MRDREESLFYHLAKRVDEGQWAEGITGEEYLEDLRSAAQDPSARLVLYTLRGGNNGSKPSRTSHSSSRSDRSLKLCGNGPSACT